MRFDLWVDLLFHSGVAEIYKASAGVVNAVARGLMRSIAFLRNLPAEVVEILSGSEKAGMFWGNISPTIASPREPGLLHLGILNFSIMQGGRRMHLPH